MFTRALLDCGLADNDLTLVEYGSEFACTLQMRFRAGQRAAIQLSKKAPDGTGSTRFTSARIQRAHGMP